MLDDNQPVYVVATHCFDECYLNDVTNKHFPRRQFAELKFKQLKKTRSIEVAKLMDDLSSHKGKIKVAISHKGFSVIAAFLEFVIEPVYREMIDDDFHKTVPISHWQICHTQ